MQLLYASEFFEIRPGGAVLQSKRRVSKAIFILSDSCKLFRNIYALFRKSSKYNFTKWDALLLFEISLLQSS